MVMRCNMNHLGVNQTLRRGSRRTLARCVALVGACVLAAGVQGQTNYDFNSGTNYGWSNWLPDEYTGADTNQGSCLPAVRIVTNQVSAGNYAVYMESCVALAAAGGSPYFTLPGVGTYFTNGALLANFTMTGEFFNWTNTQSQIFGIEGRVQLPLPAVNQPGEYNSTPGVSGYVLAFVNRRSAEAWRYEYANGSYPYTAQDELRILDTGMPGGSFPQSMGHEGAFNGLDEYQTDVSSTPDNVSGHYRLIFTALGTQLTGQMVDISTGLPMSFLSFGTVTNMLWPDPARWPVTNTLAGSYGFLCNLGDSPTVPSIGGTGIWGSYDNFAIVPGVVSLESAATPNGPYAQDTTAGIEVYPQRITVPVNGDARFYRLNWIGGTHRPRITSLTPGGSASLVTDGGLTTNVVSTMVLTYQ
jgi:hypothetical protein